LKTLGLTAVAVLFTVNLIVASSDTKVEYNHGITDPTLCESCHVQKIPTYGDSELKPCPKFHPQKWEPAAKGPAQASISYMEGGDFGPVKFNHAKHADHSMMKDGCWTCHHNHYDADKPFQKCIICHDKGLIRNDISVPRLKAAFHQQCLDCHNGWDPGASCANVCHAKNVDGTDTILPDDAVTYPPFTAPEKITFDTAKFAKTKVYFFHNGHSEMFGLECKDCHSKVECMACHDKKEKPGTRSPLVHKANEKDIHYACSSCHDVRSGKGCSKCHSKEERKMNAFDHSNTGFPLKAYHKKLKCNQCHGEKIGKRDSKCESCHKSWKGFNHSKVGVELGEVHKEFDCSNCHKKGFGKKTDCTMCHDEYYVYPDIEPMM